MEINIHFKVDEKNKNAFLTKQGILQIENFLNIKDLYNPKDPWIPYIINAIKALTLFFRNIHYIIQKLAESSMIHHIYIPYYVGILKEINSPKKKQILLKLCNRYHTEFFYENKISNNHSSYEKLCSKNKNIDNIIGFSLFISYLEKEDIINNFIEKVLDSYMNNISSKEDIELYKMLVSFESIAKIHYHIIPQRYCTILNSIRVDTKSSKIRFKIMDILGE